MIRKNQEIEVKFYVADLAAIERRLRELGASQTQARTLELNLRFDTPERELERDFRVLRLRQDTRARLTYKGPVLGHQGVRVRQEIEFEVSDFDAAREFLQALGYRVSMTYEKYRATYEVMGVEVSLDEMPYGNFVEIEGPDSETIQIMSARLSLDWEASIPSSYAVLFEALRGRLGLPFRDLIFQNFEGIEVSPEMLGVRPADQAQGWG